jgi:hypothetical protein
MQHSDDDEASAAIEAPVSTPEVGDEAALARLASAGDQRAFDLLYDRYFARTSWYFMTIFGRRKAEIAIDEVLTALFATLDQASDVSFAERAYRLSVATEVRHAAAPEKPARSTPIKVSSEKSAARAIPPSA